MHTNRRYLAIGKVVYYLLDVGKITICGLKREHKRALDIYTKNKDREECEKYSIVHTQYGDGEWNSDDSKLDFD